MVTGLTVFMVVVLPLGGLAALLVLLERRARARDAAARRQIAVTDAIHRELGPVVAPVVTRGPGRGWRLRMAVPFDSPATVERVVAIGHAAMLDTGVGEAMELVLTAQETRVPRDRVRPAAASRPAQREVATWTTTSTSRAS
jgi:hypothetical protein